MVRIIVAGGLGLIAVVASIIISIRFGRRLAASWPGSARPRWTWPTCGSRTSWSGSGAARRSTSRPRRRRSPARRPTRSRDVAQAFGSVQRTAVEAAVGQAEPAPRRQPGLPQPGPAQPALLHRQLTLLDTMERRATDPEELEDLFRLDHLTTRMRRHAEGLIILSGAAPGRGWRRPGADGRRGARPRRRGRGLHPGRRAAAARGRARRRPPSPTSSTCSPS